MRKLSFREGHAWLAWGRQDLDLGLPDLAPALEVPPGELVIAQPGAGRQALSRKTPSSFGPPSWPQSGLLVLDKRPYLPASAP